MRMKVKGYLESGKVVEYPHSFRFIVGDGDYLQGKYSCYILSCRQFLTCACVPWCDMCTCVTCIGGVHHLNTQMCTPPNTQVCAPRNTLVRTPPNTQVRTPPNTQVRTLPNTQVCAPPNTQVRTLPNTQVRTLPNTQVCTPPTHIISSCEDVRAITDLWEHAQWLAVATLGLMQHTCTRINHWLVLCVCTLQSSFYP